MPTGRNNKPQQPPPLKLLNEHGEVIAIEVTLDALEKALYPEVMMDNKSNLRILREKKWEGLLLDCAMRAATVSIYKIKGLLAKEFRNVLIEENEDIRVSVKSIKSILEKMVSKNIIEIVPSNRKKIKRYRLSSLKTFIEEQDNVNV